MSLDFKEAIDGRKRVALIFVAEDRENFVLMDSRILVASPWGGLVVIGSPAPACRWQSRRREGFSFATTLYGFPVSMEADLRFVGVGPEDRG